MIEAQTRSAIGAALIIFGAFVPAVQIADVTTLGTTHLTLAGDGSGDGLILALLAILAFTFAAFDFSTLAGLLFLLAGGAVALSYVVTWSALLPYHTPPVPPMQFSWAWALLIVGTLIGLSGAVGGARAARAAKKSAASRATPMIDVL